MAPRASVQALHPVSEEQALAWLRSQGRVTISASELGRRWSWHRQRVGRRLQAWADTGKIDRRGKTITWKNGVTAVPKAVTRVDNGGGPVTPARHTSFFRISLALLVLFLGVAIAAIMMFTNVTSWMSLARTPEAQYPIGALGLAIDAMAVTLPAAAKMAPLVRTKLLIMVMWVVAVFLVAWTQVGFASGNFGEMAESRKATIERRDLLEDRLKNIRVSLADLGERRHQCESGGACSLAKDRKGRILEVARLSTLSADTRTDLVKYELEIKTLPPIVLADPQLAGPLKAIKMLLGHKVDPEAASTWRDIVFSLVLVLLPSGLVRVAVVLW